MRHWKHTKTKRTAARSRCRDHPRRSGFTLVELAIVIGIIMILMSFALVGYRYISAKNSADQTRVALHNAEAMVTELDRMGQGWRLEGKGGVFSQGAIIANPGDVNTSPVGPGNRSQANLDCSNVLKVLLQIQANQDAYGKLSSKFQIPGSANPSHGLPAALADAWGNPMIWVPSGGLGGVKMQSRTDTNGNVTYGTTITVKSPDGRGFWASAGPDGDFSTGDDNLYSFQK